MLEKWKMSINNCKMFDALLTERSKDSTFDCVDHELLIKTKLYACGFSLTASKLVYNYISNRKKRTKIAD